MHQRTIDAAQRGDRSAQAELLRSLQDVWYRFAMSQLRDQDRAAEAAQETAFRFLRQIGGFRGQSQLSTWSLGIALNVIREMRRTRRLPEPVDAVAESADLPAQRREEAEQMRAALAELPERQREALTLRYFEDLSVQETADAMGCATGTVKACVHQALRALKRRLGGSDVATKRRSDEGEE